MATVIGPYDVYLEKAQESLEGAQSELINHRHNNVANRCYYASFQAAMYALHEAGIRPSAQESDWSHKFVQNQFVGQLINRRKLYSSRLRPTLTENYKLREVADYKRDHVTEVRARRALRRTEELLEAISQGGQ